jgi:hypothetical protein
MEGADPRFQFRHAQELIYPISHFFRRLVREGDSQYITRRNAFSSNEIGYAVSYRPSFSAAGSGNDDYRSFGRRDSQTLRLVQILEYIIHNFLAPDSDKPEARGSRFPARRVYLYQYSRLCADKSTKKWLDTGEGIVYNEE